MIRYLSRPKLRKTVLVAAWPGMGYVATSAARYLRDSVRARLFAQVDTHPFFHSTGVVFKNNVAKLPPPPGSRFYYRKDPARESDLVVFIGEAQPSGEAAVHLAKVVMDAAEKMGVCRVFTFAAAPSQIHHTAPPRVFSVCNFPYLVKQVSPLGIHLMGEGQISGLNGLLLGEARERGIEGVCFLGEIPYYAIEMENPRASCAVLEVFARMIGLDLDLSHFETFARGMDDVIDKLGQRAREAMEKFSHLAEVPEAEAHAEKAPSEKKASDTPKVPPEGRERIEKLFDLVKEDKARAMELKEELDRWEVYAEYEDRFLGLFWKKDETEGKGGGRRKA